MNINPSNKTVAIGVATAAVTILTFILTRSLGIDIPEDVATAAVTLIAIGISLFVPATSGKYVDSEAARKGIPADSLRNDTGASSS